MTNFHEKTLAAYKDLGSIYSYGYGALRACYGTYHDGTRTPEKFAEAAEEIISAVEFRTAEVMAEHLVEMERPATDCGQQPYQPVQAETSAIYQTPVSADGIARDQ